jgi:hypothetical protein
MKENIDIFTRANMFAAEGIEYDLRAITKRREQYIRNSKAAENSEKGERLPPELNVQRVRERHAVVDLLTGTTAESRHPDDRVRVKILEELEARTLSACKEIKVYVDKYRAHAATPGSRDSCGANNLNVSLHTLFEAHTVLCKACQFISLNLLGTGYHRTFLAETVIDPVGTYR